MRPKVDARYESTASREEMTMLNSSIGQQAKEHSSVATTDHVAPHVSNLCVGRRLRSKRTSRGVSESELSEKLGIDRDDLKAFERGDRRMNAAMLLRAAKALEVRPDYFFRGYTAKEFQACLESPL
jgi:ribosome-binding protein aMBF1 (putative translation factor)